MLKFGIIKQIDADKGLVKVTFPDDDDLESAWLPMVTHGSKSNKYFHIPDTDEHVACLMDGYAENGVCLGAIYSKDENPGSAKGKDIAGVVFGDGTVVKYDRSGHKMTIEIASGNVEITATKLKLTGDLEVTGKIQATDEIKSTTGNIKAPLGNVFAGPLNIGLTSHKHTGVTPGGGTTAVPIP